MWFEILGKDGKALQKYYSDLFGWKVNADNPMNYGIVDNGGREGNGIDGGIGSTPYQNMVTIYVAVSDLQATLDKAVELGGKIVMPITEIPGMVTMAQFADVEGNVIGLILDQQP